jgi:hypothetical protein
VAVHRKTGKKTGRSPFGEYRAVRRDENIEVVHGVLNYLFDHGFNKKIFGRLGGADWRSH